MNLLIPVILSLSSCNVINTYYGYQIKRLESKGFKEHHITDEQCNIHYVSKITEGKPVVFLLHGFGADGVNQYYKTALLLSREYDVVAPDLFFHGYSTTKDTSYSFDIQVELLEKIIDKLGIDSNLIFIGNSYGGMIATLYASQNKEKVEKLFLYDSPLMFFSLSQADSIAKAYGIKSVEDLLCPVTAKDLRKTLSFVFHCPPPVPKFILKQMINFPYITPREDKIRLLQNLENESKHYPQFKRSDLPELYLLWGENDVFIPLSVCYALKDYWQLEDSRVYIFPRSSHVANFEHPRKFAKVTKDMILLK